MTSQEESRDLPNGRDRPFRVRVVADRRAYA